MTLEQLKIFVTAAHMEHFTRAAMRLNVSQSMVSGTVAALENELNVSLFHRSRKHVTLSESGNAFLEEAEGILGRVNSALKRMESLSRMQAGHVCIAASQTVAHYWLPQLLEPFRASYPGLTIDVLDGNSVEVEQLVLNRHADFGIAEQAPGLDALRSASFQADNLVLIVGKHHPWFGRNHVEWSELIDTSWVMREPGSDMRDLFESALIQHGVSPGNLDISLVLRSGEALVNAVASGRWAAMVSDLAAVTAVRGGLVRVIDGIRVRRAFHELTIRGMQLAKAADALRAHISSSSRDEQVSQRPTPA